MERAHEALLTARLEDAMLHGCSHITWDELYHWYGLRKIAAGTWRDLKNRWEELTEDRNVGQLMRINGKGGIFIFGEDKAQPVKEE
ncbi:MAG: hypothetical protein ACJ71W_04480 [Terriglobales bacterium]|jgi:hypothetical protein